MLRAQRALLTLLMGLCASIVAFQVMVAPVFGSVALESPAYDYMSHIALVTATAQTWAGTHLPPVSSDAIYPGTEYPYFLFGNIAFYAVAGLVSWVAGVAPYLGAGWVISAAVTAGVMGIVLLARSAGINRVYATALGFFYATGPYLAVNLLVRTAFPEFVAWELLPLIFFVGRQCLVRSCHALSWVPAALALSIPLYIHKLVGPHIILFVLAVLAANTRWSCVQAIRFALVCLSIPCLTVFAWLPVLTIDRSQIQTLRVGGLGAIGVLNDSIVNFLWPWAVNSLPPMADQPLYAGRFALQLGVVPMLGAVLAVWRLAAHHFRLPIRDLYAGPLAVAIYSCLVLGPLGVTRFLPFPLDTIQASYRLIGLAHFAGFLALIAALQDVAGQRWVGLPSRTAAVVAGVLGAASLASISSYWRFSPPANYRAADIEPKDLIDQSSFFPQSYRSTFETSDAIAPDGWLKGAGGRVELRGFPSTVVLQADIPSFVFDGDSTPLTLRVFGTDSYVQQPPGESLLTHEQASGPGRLELHVGIPANIRELVVECSRVVGPVAVNARAFGQRSLCARVVYLGPPNDGPGIVVPRPIPDELVTHGALGALRIAAAALPAGQYELPTFDYDFVRVSAPDGARISTYQFNSRPVITHDGLTREYAVTYDLHLEWWVVMGWAVAVLLEAVYAGRAAAARSTGAKWLRCR